MHVSIMLNWGAAGNVIGYNYSANDFDENAYNVVMGDFSMHGSHPMFNLYEGNIATSFHPDGIWGSNSHNTLFRSWLMGTTKICKPLVRPRAGADRLHLVGVPGQQGDQCGLCRPVL